MNASNFLANRAPTELVHAIFQFITSECISDAVALSLTCSRLRNHWTTHRSALLWDLCIKHVPHAQEALLAARMTSKVADAEISGRLPPKDISPGDLLSGSVYPKLSMTLSEYQQVRALNLLARDREARLYHWPRRVWSFPDDRPQQAWGETVSPEEPCSMPEWSDRVHLALYRTMIIAAGLAGAYHEPTLKATDPEAGMSLICAQMKYSEQHPTNYPTLTAKEVDWLEQFTVCNMDSTPEAEEAVYGRVANWLLGNILEKKSSREAMAWRFAHNLGRATYCRRLRDSGRDCPVQLVVDGSGTWTHADAHLVVWELMQVFYIFDYIQEGYIEIFNPDRGDPSRRALAVFPGLYAVLEHEVPENAEAPYRSWYLVNNSPSPLIRPRPSVSKLLPWIHDRGERPNTYISDHDNYFSTPPLGCKFFEYFLRRYCKLRFDNDAFAEGGEFNTYTSRELRLFANDHVGGKFTREAPMASNLTTRSEDEGILTDGDFYDGSEGLTSCDPPPILKYREMEPFFF